MAKLPSFQFYPGDWLKDPNLRRCTKSARGVWIDMVCLSFECEERGVFAASGEPWPDGDIAAAIGGDIAENLRAIDELLAKGVCSRNNSGAIFCRRVVRDEQKRRLCSEAGKKGGGNPDLTFKGVSKGTLKGGSKGTSKRNAKASSSSSSSDLNVFVSESETGQNSIVQQLADSVTFQCSFSEEFLAWWQMLPPKMAVRMDGVWSIWPDVLIKIQIRHSIDEKSSVLHLMHRTRMFLNSPKGKREFKRCEAKSFLTDGIYDDDPQSWEVSESTGQQSRFKPQSQTITPVSQIRTNAVGGIIHD